MHAFDKKKQIMQVKAVTNIYFDYLIYLTHPPFSEIQTTSSSSITSAMLSISLGTNSGWPWRTESSASPPVMANNETTCQFIWYVGFNICFYAHTILRANTSNSAKTLYPQLVRLPFPKWYPCETNLGRLYSEGMMRFQMTLVLRHKIGWILDAWRLCITLGGFAPALRPTLHLAVDKYIWNIIIYILAIIIRRNPQSTHII